MIYIRHYLFVVGKRMYKSQRGPSPQLEDDGEATDDGMIDDHPECEEDDHDTRFLDLEPEVKIHIGRNVFVVGKRLFKTVDIREYFFLATKKLQVRTLQKLHIAFR